MTAASALEIDNVSQSFGGVRAVIDVSCNVTSGEFFGIIGPNGAGKTTLLNCVSRVHRDYRGDVRIGGRSTKGKRAHQLLAMGVARTFQAADFFSDFTVWDYLMLGRHRHQDSSLFRNALSGRSSLRLETTERELVRDFAFANQLGGVLNTHLRELPYGTRKLVDLVRAQATGADILLLDEPTSGTATEDREALVELLEGLRESGTTVILVDHDISFVSKLCSRLLVMDYGESLGIGPTDEVLNRPEIMKAYTGVAEA